MVFLFVKELSPFDAIAVCVKDCPPRQGWRLRLHTRVCLPLMQSVFTVVCDPTAFIWLQTRVYFPLVPSIFTIVCEPGRFHPTGTARFPLPLRKPLNSVALMALVR